METRRNPHETKRITGKVGLLDGAADAAFEQHEWHFLIGIALEGANHTGMESTVAPGQQTGLASVVHRDPRSHQPSDSPTGNVSLALT